MDLFKNVLLKIKRTTALAALGLCTATLSASAYSATSAADQMADDSSRGAGMAGVTRAATPAGLNKVFVYMADGLYDPLTNNPNSEITNCNPLSNLCDGEYFQKEILGRNDEEIAAEELAAKAFFKQRFGLDVDDPAFAGRLYLRMFQIDPRVNYHVISASDERVPSAGWHVSYGGWILFVTDPEGVDLGGDFVGGHTGVGGMYLYGENSIAATSKKHCWFGDWACWFENRHMQRDPIVLHYQTHKPPFVPRPGPMGVGDSALMFQLELSHPEYGAGLARGRGEILPREDGLIKLNIVSVLSFPGLSDIPAAE